MTMTMMLERAPQRSSGFACRSCLHEQLALLLLVPGGGFIRDDVAMWHPPDANQNTLSRE